MCVCVCVCVTDLLDVDGFAEDDEALVGGEAPRDVPEKEAQLAQCVLLLLLQAVLLRHRQLPGARHLLNLQLLRLRANWGRTQAQALGKVNI